MCPASLAYRPNLQAVKGLAVTAVLCAGTLSPAASQVVRGQVRTADSDEAVQRARIELLDRAGYRYAPCGG